VIKPYERPLESHITKSIFGSPFALVLDYNADFFIERKAITEQAKKLFVKGELDSESLGGQ